MMLKKFLRENILTRDLYAKLSKMRREKYRKNLFSFDGTFDNRAKGSENLLIVLAGYKDFLYPAVFSRIEKYLEKNIDVCVASSGLFSEKLSDLCEKNDWSYLSTKENNVCLIQNVAISLHPQAKMIFKLDEDVFITEGYFKHMLQAYDHALSFSDYVPGLMAPILNVNGFGHMRILKKLGLEEEFSVRFETPKYMAGPHRKIEKDPDTAKFMWGEGGFVPFVDDLNKSFSQEPLKEFPCSIRLSIGAILFPRQLWEDMGYFNVDRSRNQMGEDEGMICSYCCSSSRPVMVSDNIVVGHLSFGTQNEAMKEYYFCNQDKFCY